jgi:hypothetical protein
MALNGLQYPTGELPRDIKDALQGSNGEPSETNRYVTKSDVATTGNNGLMSSSDKAKLDGLGGAAVTLTAGAGLTGGGQLSQDRAIDIVAANGTITVNADSIQVGVITATEHGSLGGGTLHSAATTSVNGFMSSTDKTKLDGLITNATPQTRTLTAGAGLTGGGDLSVDRTFDIAAADSSITVNADSIQVGVISDTNHGTRGGGTLHSVATQSVAGFMSAQDKYIVDNALTTAPGSGTIGLVQVDSYRTQLDTTSTTYQLYRTFNTASVPAGTFRIGWTYQWAGSSTSSKVEVEVRLDGTPIDYIAITPRAGDDRNSNGGFYYMTFLTETTHTITIYVRSSSAGKTATIYQSDLEFWRSYV